VCQVREQTSAAVVRENELKALAARSGVVLLYHGTFSTVPKDLLNDLHNIHPERLTAQIDYLGRFFRFVSVDQLAQMTDPRGFAALTFDDGYRCVIDEALPHLVDRKIPITIYLNGANFEGGVFWRDQVRLVERRNWVAQFESQMSDIDQCNGRRFYRYTKSVKNDSRVVAKQLTEFLAAQPDAILSQYCIDNIAELPNHPLVSYGNHSHNHYVLASMDEAAQRSEIAATKHFLEKLPAISRSGLFSIPFGAANDFNANTVNALRQHGYSGVLMSRNRLQSVGKSQVHGIDAYERYMPRSDDLDAGLAKVFTNT
jgi:peptidoglycan/xylan/chitin deacetylase (PgdA/CDA1 family)